MKIMIRSRKFRDTRTGEIVTQIPILEMEYFEEVDDDEEISDDRH